MWNRSNGCDASLLQPVLDLELCRELDELQKSLDDDNLSGSCLHHMNIWKESIHIINRFQ